MRGRYLVVMLAAGAACARATESRIQVLPSVSERSAEGSEFGSLVAIVTNADTAALPNAQVALTPVDSFKAVWRIAAATAPGEYRIDSIAPGRYTVRTAALGFSYARQRLSVTAGRTVRLHIRLMPRVMCMDYCR